MESKNNQGIFKVAIGVLIGVVALLSYLFMGARNETFELQKSLTTKVEELSTAQIKFDSISKVLDIKIAEVEKLGGNVKELMAVKAQLEEDKKKLKTDFNFSVQKYETKVKEYETFLTAKDDDILKLKSENGTLLARTKTLEDEKQQVITENSGLKTDKESLSQTVASYTAQNDDLKRKVTLATAMKAINVQVAAMASNGKLREGGLYKSSKIDRLKISFIMPSNPVAEKNTKDIFVRILDQNGAVVSEDGNAGTVQFEGKELGYSLKQAIPFENNDQKVDVLYGKGSGYKTGKYAIELYSEGFKIGTGAFEVK
jgi:predicted nuclease with TOPRIM domain